MRPTRLLRSAIVLKPSTILRFHRELVKRKYRLLFTPKTRGKQRIADQISVVFDVERLIGTVRREYLDQVPFWSARDLERKLMSFQNYYYKDRVQRGLDGAPPNEQSEIADRKIARPHNYRWEKRCHGLYQLPVAA